jgi:hypothetical protein
MARWWPGLLKNNVITGLLKSKKTAQQPNMKAWWPSDVLLFPSRTQPPLRSSPCPRDPAPPREAATPALPLHLPARLRPNAAAAPPCDPSATAAPPRDPSAAVAPALSCAAVPTLSCAVAPALRSSLTRFFIFNLSWFSKNKWLNQNFWQMYLWRRGPRRLEFLPPWATALGETPTVGRTGWWGQILTPRPTAQEILAPWAVAAAPTYIRGRTLPLAPHSSLQTFGFQPLRSASEVCF